MTQKKGIALNDLSIQVKKLMWFGYPWKHMNSSQDNSFGHVCDPRCEEVLVLEEMGRKDKIPQEFNPHMALMPRPVDLCRMLVQCSKLNFFWQFFWFSITE